MKYLRIFFLLCISVISLSIVQKCTPAEERPAITIDKKDLRPLSALAAYTYEQFECLIKLANAGHAPSQYALAFRYFSSNNPLRILDYAQAEKWALEARKNDYLPAYLMLFDIATAQGDDFKKLTYAQDAVARGFKEMNFKIGELFEQKKDDERAREYYQRAFGTKFDLQARGNFAVLLLHGMGGPKDVKQGIDILKELANKNSLPAQYHLAMQYLFGNEVLQRNVEEAYKLLTKAVSAGHDTYEEHYNYSMVELGLITEKGFGNRKPNPKEALTYFAKVKEFARAETQIARLIWTNKVPGDREKALETIKKNADYIDVMAGFLYGLILISQGQQTEAIKVFEQLKDEYDQFPLVLLQVGIAYYYGFGVEQDVAKAESYFKRILSLKDVKSQRALFLAEGYMYLFGLGVEKDISRGLQLINESEKLHDDVYFSTEELFPAITKLRQDLYEQALAEFGASKAQPTQQTKQAKKRKPKKAAQTASSQPTKISTSLTDESTITVKESAEEQKKQLAQLLASKALPQDLFEITPQEWNEYFPTKDKSVVTEINATERTITIEDPQRQERLIVKAHNVPTFTLNEIEELQMAPRIAHRQGKGTHAKLLSRKTIEDHSFADMLDYVIQYAGQYVPFFKNGTKEPEDSLIADVTRIDLKNGKLTHATAEYTFRRIDGRKGQGFEVYHRLLRPQRDNRTEISYVLEKEEPLLSSPSSAAA